MCYLHAKKGKNRQADRTGQDRTGQDRTGQDRTDRTDKQTDKQTETSHPPRVQVELNCLSAQMNLGH